jgi:hypothetical protein
MMIVAVLTLVLQLFALHGPPDRADGGDKQGRTLPGIGKVFFAHLEIVCLPRLID